MRATGRICGGLRRTIHKKRLSDSGTVCVDITVGRVSVTVTVFATAVCGSADLRRRSGLRCEQELGRRSTASKQHNFIHNV